MIFHKLICSPSLVDSAYCRNLVQFYGACVAANSLMLVMELMDGKLLRLN